MESPSILLDSLENLRFGETAGRWKVSKGDVHRVSRLEAKGAIFGLATGKALGPHRLPIEVFKYLAVFRTNVRVYVFLPSISQKGPCLVWLEATHIVR